jgi:hypothetical protein
MEKVAKLLILTGMFFWSGNLFAITASEIYNDALRAYKLGNFSESEESFDRFLKTWPNHKLEKSARFHRTICKAKTIEQKQKAYTQQLVASLAADLASIKDDFSASELSQARLSLLQAEKKNGSFSWNELKNLGNDDLNRILTNSNSMDPVHSPISALEFVNHRERNFYTDARPELIATLSILKARALWQLLLSPLSLNANARILKTWGDWPVHNSLDKSLRIGFAHGDIEQKKKIALLGFHFDCFRHKGVISSSNSSDLKSRWLTYLSERGTNLQEVWCPR